MNEESASRRFKRMVIQQLESWQRAGLSHLPKPGSVQPDNFPTTSNIPAGGNSGQQEPSQSAEAFSTRPSGPESAAIADGQRKTYTRKTAVGSGGEDRAAALKQLAAQVARCRRCPELVRNRTQTVFGTGNPYAQLVFVGEAPGADEDRLGEPFVGAAGQLLTDMIEKGMGLRRSEVYIMNILRCRPPNNRTPLPEEAQNCRPFLEKQLAIVQPKFICCLGACAAQNLLGVSESISRLRGNVHSYKDIPVVCTYHPAYLLRTPDAKRLAWEDLKLLMSLMGLPIRPSGREKKGQSPKSGP